MTAVLHLKAVLQLTLFQTTGQLLQTRVLTIFKKVLAQILRI